jgi:hypothetical protein
MDKQPIFVVNCCDLITTYSNTLEEKKILMTCLMQVHLFYATKKQLHKTSVVALDKSLISIFLLVIYVDFYTSILVMVHIKYYINFFYHCPTSIIRAMLVGAIFNLEELKKNLEIFKACH